MARKMKGGLGDSALIQDLTKPIRFHLPESLEPPPVYERRKDEPEPKVPSGRHEHIRQMMRKAARALGEEAFQVIYHPAWRGETLIVETVSGGEAFRIFAARGAEGAFTEVPWEASSFAALDREEAPSLAGAGVTVSGDEHCIRFTSPTDFHEWLNE